MKYNVLLTGSHQIAIDEFFFNMATKFDAISCSARSMDIKKHIAVFKPQALILCITPYDVDLARTIVQLKAELQRNNVAVAVLGESEAIDEFMASAKNIADLVLRRPLTNSSIISKFEEFFVERQRKLDEEERLRQKALQEEMTPKKHILVVDDDPGMLKLIKSQLEDEYNIATAINGNLALRFLTTKSTDLILLDYEMPGQDGSQVLSILRGSETTRDIPVIFLTGVSEPAKIAKVLALKPKGYLLKPVDNNKLHDSIKKALEE